MRRFALFALALALGAPACDDDSPTGPTSSGPVVFTAELRASNEVPAVSNAESNAQGTVTITFDVPRDANGAVTGNGTWTVQAIVSNFTDTSAIRASHIHNGPAGVSAGVFVDTLLTPANAIPLTGGAGVINFEQVRITKLQAQAVMDNPAGNYFNMHTPLNPGGAIRGQLTRVR